MGFARSDHLPSATHPATAHTWHAKTFGRSAMNKARGNGMRPEGRARKASDGRKGVERFADPLCKNTRASLGLAPRWSPDQVRAKQISILSTTHGEPETRGRGWLFPEEYLKEPRDCEYFEEYPKEAKRL